MKSLRMMMEGLGVVDVQAEKLSLKLPGRGEKVMAAVLLLVRWEAWLECLAVGDSRTGLGFRALVGMMVVVVLAVMVTLTVIEWYGMTCECGLFLLDYFFRTPTELERCKEV